MQFFGAGKSTIGRYFLRVSEAAERKALENASLEWGAAIKSFISDLRTSIRISVNVRSWKGQMEQKQYSTLEDFFMVAVATAIRSAHARLCVREKLEKRQLWFVIRNDTRLSELYEQGEFGKLLLKIIGTPDSCKLDIEPLPRNVDLKTLINAFCQKWKLPFLFFHFDEIYPADDFPEKWFGDGYVAGAGQEYDYVIIDTNRMYKFWGTVERELLDQLHLVYVCSRTVVGCKLSFLVSRESLATR